MDNEAPQPDDTSPIDLALTQAKRVRREATILVRMLARAKAGASENETAEEAHSDERDSSTGSTSD